MATRRIRAEAGGGGEADDLSQEPGEGPRGDNSAEPKRQPLADYFELTDDPSDEVLRGIADRQVQFTIAETAIADRCNVLLLFDTSSIGRSDADRIYSALSTVDRSKPILLVMHSPGGDVAAAYQIAKLCREYTDATFEVAVPRQAKSAATLIACGADAIHMGSLSELGPIDPQFGAIPALALKHSVEHLAALAAQYPEAAEMFAKYLSASLRVEALGYYERVAASATHYAERLLNARLRGAGQAKAIAERLVYDYKDHGFVIDSREASEIFGDDVVLSNTPEYMLANALYGALDFMEWIVGRRFARTFAFTGGPHGGCMVFRRSST